MKSFERCFRRSAFEAGFEGVELQGEGRQRQPKIRQLVYARISIHGLQGSRQGEFGQPYTSVRQYRDRTTVTGSITYDLQASGTAGGVSGNRRPLSDPRVAGAAATPGPRRGTNAREVAKLLRPLGAYPTT